MLFTLPHGMQRWKHAEKVSAVLQHVTRYEGGGFSHAIAPGLI
jgi:hypothetical protein